MTTMSPETEPKEAVRSDSGGTGSQVFGPAGKWLGQLGISRKKILTTVPIYAGIALMWLYFNSQTGGTFISPRNLSEMANEFSYEVVLAIGVVFVLLLGEIDLSLGYLTLLSVALTASYSQLNGWNAAISIILPIIVCTLCGLAQGFFISLIRMPSFVVTLGGLLIFQGIAGHILSGSTVNVFDPFIVSLGTYNLPDLLSWGAATGLVALYVLGSVVRLGARARAGLPRIGMIRTVFATFGIAIVLGVVIQTMNNYRGVPVSFGILLVLVIAFGFFATQFRFGRHIYAVGGNLEAARRAGINTTAVRWIVFGISGFFAGIAGVMLVGYASAGSTTSAGPDLLLDVISIAVIGGVSLTGGRGSVWAVMIGGLVLASLNSGLNLMATDPYYVYVIKGVILVTAILVDVVGKRWEELPFRRWALELTTAVPSYPVDFQVDYPQNPGKLYAVPLLGIFIREILLIPHIIVLYLLTLLVGLINLIAWVPVLFGGSYHPGLYNFVSGYLRWSGNVSAYFLGLTDTYPPFSRDQQEDFPVRVTFEPPERSARFWAIPVIGYVARSLALIPHAIALIVVTLVVYVVHLAAWVPVLFRGTYPRWAYWLSCGAIRWTLRVNAYFYGLTDQYPPFSLAGIPVSASLGAGDRAA
jgi:D-xylose transport system permease protein